MEKDHLRINIASVSTNQQALDFANNKNRIFKSIEVCKSIGVTYRAGGELEIPGYSCDDHFKELDTIYHCWEVVNDLLQTDLSEGIICEMNMPVIHKSVCYNSKVLVYNRRIIFIKPKVEVADEANYRESRYFVPYRSVVKGQLEQFTLPHIIERQTGQRTCPFGTGIVQFLDTVFGLSFSRLSIKQGQSRLAFLNNADFVVGSTALHFSKNIEQSHINAIQAETAKNGGAYVYCNLIGCDGNNTYFGGGNAIVQNGNILSVGKYHTLNEIEICTGVLNLQKIRLLRQKFTGGQRMTLDQDILPVVHVDSNLCSLGIKYTKPMEVSWDPVHQQYVEVASSYMWDYLVKTAATGFVLPLDGGANSTCIAMMVYYLCLKIFKEVAMKNVYVTNQLRRIVNDAQYTPKDPLELCGKILHTVYLGNSDDDPKAKVRAEAIAKKIGSNHKSCDFSKIFQAFRDWIPKNLPFNPRTTAEGGSCRENLILHNLQARLRMVLTYMIAQLTPMKRNAEGNPQGGFLIVFGVYNVDQALLGFTTKYDTSSGDINPIGTLNHHDVMQCLHWFDKALKWDSLNQVLTDEPKEVPPTYVQENEDSDFSLSWHEVETLSKFRSERNCGPFSMFDNLAEFWPDFDLEQLYDTVVLFFDTYSRNRHKSIIHTPALYLSNHSVDSNKFNYTPHIYNGFEYQYKKMKALKESIQMANLAKLHKDTNIRHAQTGTIRQQSKHKEGTEKDDHHHDEGVGPNPFDFAQKEQGIGRQVDIQSNESMSVDK